MDSRNLELVGKLKTAQRYNFPTELTVRNNRVVGATIDYRFRDNYVRTAMSDYEPSNIASFAEANRIFTGLYRRHKWWDQCFNRAHIWAKQMHDHHQVRSMKILIYYTRKYRREISDKWWFHIAPVVSINGELHSMDREFTSRPLPVDEWEQVFTSGIPDRNYRCKKIDHISEYYNENNMRNEYCNIQFVSMYYWEPNDMSRLDRSGEEKHRWINREIRAAAREAFRGWRRIYRELKE